MKFFSIFTVLFGIATLIMSAAPVLAGEDRPVIQGTRVRSTHVDVVVGDQIRWTQGNEKRFDDYYRRQDRLYGTHVNRDNRTVRIGTPSKQIVAKGTVTRTVTYYPPTGDRSLGRAVQATGDITEGVGKAVSNLGEAIFGKPQK